jgi:hypothetical protein
MIEVAVTMVHGIDKVSPRTVVAVTPESGENVKAININKKMCSFPLGLFLINAQQQDVLGVGIQQAIWQFWVPKLLI